MMTVIRRSRITGALLLLVALTATACGSLEQDALAVGDRAISRSGLNELVVTVNPQLEPAAEGGEIRELPADVVRAIANVWLTNAAEAEVLETMGETFDDDEREDAKLVVEEAIAAGSIQPLDRDTEGFEALLVNVWLGGVRPVLSTSTSAVAEIEQLLADAHVDSRIGFWDRDSGQILPVLIADR